ncbi:alpha/beta hydrolase [Kribbella sp. NPDC005582]|uniref:alpha/beta fold hydrolase n=1 Tax=Kribbella sp. NPDC005582 TaxID=3156893 RepID=UPI0033B36A8D
MDLQGVSHRFVDLAGVRLHVTEAGSGEAVLMLHGFPQHWWEYRDVIPALAQKYRVICPDLRGAGESDAPPTGYDRETLLGDVTGLLDALELDRVHLLTHDWSGMLGFLLCLQNPERVRDHLVLSIPPPGAKPELSMLPKVLRHGWFNLLLPWPGLGPWALHRTSLARTMLRGHTVAMPEETIELFASQFTESARAVAGSALYRTFIQPEGLRMMRAKNSQRLTTPTRVLVGAEDHVVRAGSIHGYEPFVDDLEVVEVAGASHFLVDDRPDAVIEHALEFFAQH